MSHPLEELRDAALREIAGAPNEQSLEAARVKYLGRSGSISAWGEQMKSLSKEERPIVGKLLNEARTAVTAAIEEAAKKLRDASEMAALANIDITLPGTSAELGSLHPLTQMLDRAIQIFRRMGFALADGPDIDDEWHCFDALNTPPDHPARNEQDTFLSSRWPLAAHAHFDGADSRDAGRASAHSRHRARAPHIGAMKSTRRIARSFIRSKDCTWMKMSASRILKGTLEFLMHELFGPETAVRFRPHYFPFTEPSFEIDVKSKALRGGEQWIEVCGCGHGASGALRRDKPRAWR